MALFDRVADTYELWYQDHVGKIVDKLECALVFKHLIPGRGSLVLDAGCGTGIYSRRLAKKGLYVVGIDASEEMLQIARNKQVNEDPVIEYVKGDLHYLPFKDRIFDSVVCIAALEFCRNAKQVIHELGRVLKPQGQIVFGVLNKESNWMNEILLSSDPSSIYSHAHLFSPAELKELITQTRLFNSVSLESSVFFSPSQYPSSLPSLYFQELKGKICKPMHGGFFVCSTRKKV